jgi:two-component system NtrC family sensor kinase
MKILNVDDNDGVRYAKSRTLQRAGFTVIEAASGAETLRLVAAEQPEVVLLDVKLPDINGFEVCSRIKSNPATAAIIVVQMSAAFVDSRDRTRGLEGGADAYLTEPVQPEELLATIKALLRLRQVETELRQTRDTLETRVQERTADLERAIKALRQEITKRIRSEKALRASYEFLQSTLDALPSYVAILDNTGTILTTNAAWQRFVAAADLAAMSYGRGMDFVEFFPAAIRADAASVQTVIAGVREVLTRQRDMFFCEYISPHQAESLWFFVRVVRFDGPEGMRVVVVIEDITEVKRAEEALRRQQETMYQSEKLAAMGALLASVAHELNNPLGVAQVQLDLLREEAKDSALQERITELQQATERCVRIVHSFLTLARRSPLQRAPVQLNIVVEASLQLLAHALHLDNVMVHRHLADNLPLIGADATQLQQVVVNLLLNAQQALHETSASRQVTLTTRYDPSRARVILEVADTGPGIPSQLQARIFEPFFTTKPVGIGTGLGLPVCQGIIEGHGGTMSVMSRPGHGAVFCIELPVGAMPAPQPPESEAPLPSSPTAILIVDDEIGIARGLARLLRRDGHQVDTAGSGRQALAMLQAREYDLILCDLRMPELDGPGFYRAVAARQPHLLPRFVFLTGDTLGPEARAFLDEVSAPRLVKPFSATEGRRVVRQALRALHEQSYTALKDS